MYGFTINKGFNINPPADRIITFGDSCCINNMISKFENDKVFFEDQDCILILDGVILNKRELIIDNDWCMTLKKLYFSNGKEFFKVLRGCFSGAVYNKKSEEWLVFTDQLGQKFIYYYYDGCRFSCSSMIGEVYKVLKQNNIDYNLDDKAPYMLLSYGFMLDNYTLCREIKKIRPGSYIIISQNGLREYSYYQLDNEPNYRRTEAETIAEIDRLFSQAVNRQYKKDDEYGYKHVCALSGGLDCRMTTFVSNELGFKSQLNITFSESDYYDDFLPKQMSRDLKHEWIFKPLDNGLWLFDVDKITQVTGGNVLYYGLAHSDSLYRYLDFSSLGMVHSGQLGDIVIGSKTKSHKERYAFGDGAYSKKYTKYLEDAIVNNFPNHEIGCWYTRYLNGANNGLQNIYNYTETCSPFMDLDFLEFCLSIPSELRYNHKLYRKWVILKHPQAANYVWETTGAKLNEPTIDILGKSIPISQIVRKAYLKIMITLGIKSTETLASMNPLKKYIANNKDLSDYYQSYFQYLDLIKDEKLRSIIKEIKKNGTAVEINQAVSLLSALKVFF